MEQDKREVASTGGEKGTNEFRYDLVPAGPMFELAKIYGRGAEKYIDRNWERGYRWGLSFAAMMRHAWKFWRGKTIDEDTGCHHMACVAFHAFALIQFSMEERYAEFDDRAKSLTPAPTTPPREVMYPEYAVPEKRNVTIQELADAGIPIKFSERCAPSLHLKTGGEQVGGQVKVGPSHDAQIQHPVKHAGRDR